MNGENINHQILEAIVELNRTQLEAQKTLQQCVDLLKQNSSDEWVEPKDFATRASMAVSVRMILERIRDGRLKRGTHYIDTSDGDRPNYLISIQACKTHFMKPPEKRRPAQKLTE
jgi:hypothetical protein